MVTEGILRKRFLRLLRMAHPKRGDTVVAVTLSNPQSYLMLKLLVSIEQAYASRVVLLHLGEHIPSSFEKLCKECSHRIHLQVTPGSITQLKLLAAKAVAAFEDPLCVLPLTAEEMASYILGELLAGDLSGLALDLMYRTAYPLSTTLLSEVPVEEGAAPGCPHVQLTPSVTALLQSLAGRVDLPALSRLYLRLIHNWRERGRAPRRGSMG